MRGRKSYNIRNVEAHINNIKPIQQEPIFRPIAEPTFILNRQLIFNNQESYNNQINQVNQVNQVNQYKNNHFQQLNQYINAKYGVSRYASNQVSGKMFKHL
jgi:hypothetical protein